MSYFRPIVSHAVLIFLLNRPVLEPRGAQACSHGICIMCMTTNTKIFTRVLLVGGRHDWGIVCIYRLLGCGRCGYCMLYGGESWRVSSCTRTGLELAREKPALTRTRTRHTRTDTQTSRQHTDTDKHPRTHLHDAIAITVALDHGRRAPSPPRHLAVDSKVEGQLVRDTHTHTHSGLD